MAGFYAGAKLKAGDFNGDAKKELLGMMRQGLAVAESAQSTPKAIVKEGLSEYFIFTVEGTETVHNTWSKRMRLFAGKDVPFRIEYRYRPQEYGDQLVRMFLLRNATASDLGTTPLPDGIVRLYRDNGRDGLSFMLQQQIKYVPIGQEIELNLGVDPEVIHERVHVQAQRDSYWFHRNGVDVYYSPTQGHAIEVNDTVAGWDDHQVWEERIRNYRDKPIAVQIRRSFDGDTVFRSNLDPKLYDFRSPEFAAEVAAGEKELLRYELVMHQGRNQKQTHVTLDRLK
jgi:hypothetical protein